MLRSECNRGSPAVSWSCHSCIGGDEIPAMLSCECCTRKQWLEKISITALSAKGSCRRTCHGWMADHVLLCMRTRQVSAEASASSTRLALFLCKLAVAATSLMHVCLSALLLIGLCLLSGFADLVRAPRLGLLYISRNAEVTVILITGIY